MNALTHNLWKFLHKLLNAVEKLPGLRGPLTRPRVRAMREEILARYVAGLPDRRYWNETVMPALLKAGFKRILFVGCGSYTRDVHRAFEAQGVECWTSDIIPENAQWGNPDRHITCDIADIRAHVPEAHFDAILFNGVMGYGVTGEHMKVIAPELAAILRPPALLVIGWNKGLVEDPLTLPWVTECFRHEPYGSMPARREFSDSTHVFDLFTKAPGRNPS